MATISVNNPQNDLPLGPLSPCRRPDVAPYCARVQKQLSPERFAHVMRVAELAQAIALGNHFDADDLTATLLAAVLHDVARELDADTLYRLAPPENEIEARDPLTVHGRAGRAVAASWGVADARVLDAIEGHVFGCRPGERVAMAVYIADVSEPGRGVNGEIRQLAMVNLASAYNRAVQAKVRYLQGIGKGVHPRTLQVHEELGHAP
jgi:predicted HD superfamily hydrolase involved in NAD metabolism